MQSPVAISSGIQVGVVTLVNGKLKQRPAYGFLRSLNEALTCKVRGGLTEMYV